LGHHEGPPSPSNNEVEYEERQGNQHLRTAQMCVGGHVRHEKLDGYRSEHQWKSRLLYLLDLNVIEIARQSATQFGRESCGRGQPANAWWRYLYCEQSVDQSPIYGRRDLATASFAFSFMEYIGVEFTIRHSHWPAYRTGTRNS
jgi:hypothetical protein